MDLLLIGYGKMNHLVAEMAAEQGHRVVKTIRRPGEWVSGWTPGLVAIDFSVPEAVLDHVERCMEAGIPLVIGTTGWNHHRERVQELVSHAQVGAVYGANFSVGVHAFYRIVRAAAQSLPASYEPYVWEAHHAQKRDAPSGTAKHLAALLEAGGRSGFSVASTRAGAIPGTHVVGWEGADDSITLTHTARSRRGFAAGAVVAAHWILGRRGLHEFGEVMDSIASGAPR